MLSGVSRASKFYVREVKDRKITLRVSEEIVSDWCNYIIIRTSS